jgi:S1-C subfamily serine protease
MTDIGRRVATLLVAAVIVSSVHGVVSASGDALPPWFVQVNHRIDLDRYLEVVRGDMPDVDLRAQTLRRVTNLTAGVLVDTDGHVVTRLVNYDPRVTDLELSVTANDGRRFPATIVGLDAPTGFVVLHAPGLRGTQPAPPTAVQELKASETVEILRRDYAPGPVKQLSTGRRAEKHATVLPTLPPMRGNVDGASVPATIARTGAVSTIKSAAFLSAGDLSLVRNLSGQFLGVARYELRGFGQLVPIAFLRDVVAKRILDVKGSVECGWLGADGASLEELPSEQRPESPAKGVLIRKLVENGPAERAGLAVDDLVVGFDEVAVTSLADLGALVRSTPAGTAVSLSVIRLGKPATFRAVLGKRPPASAIRLAPTSPDFGLEVLDLNPQLADFLGVSNGVFVQYVREGTPARTGGLRAGDVITLVGDTPIVNRAGFNAAIASSPSPTVRLSVHREKKVVILTVSLSAPR